MTEESNAAYQQAIADARRAGILAADMDSQDLAFMAVGKLSDGRILLVDKDGEIWEAKKAEIPTD